MFHLWWKENLLNNQKISKYYEHDCGSIKTYAEIRYLVSFGDERYNAIYDNIRYLISGKSSITCSFSHNFVRIGIDLDNSLAVEKTLTLHNVIILIRSVVNKNKNNHYYNMFLEKGLYENKSNTHCFKINVCIS